MKINLVGKSFEIGSGQGIYQYSGELFNELKRRGVDVSVNKKGDINHVMQPELIWKALFKKKVVTTVHDVMPIFMDERHPLVRIHFYFSMFLASIKSKKIIADSECTKQDIIKYFPFVKNKVETIYLWVDSKKLFPIYNKKKNKKFTIGYFGGLGKRKNVKFILEIAKRFPKVKFLIAGKGPEKERLEMIRKDNHLINVDFIGFVPEEKMNEFYNSLDLFIFPSIYEGFGLPVLEAMTAGVPVVVSNKGSLPEIVGASGILIDPEASEKVCTKIEEIINNVKIRKIMKENSIKQSKNFSQTRYGQDILEIYNDLK